MKSVLQRSMLLLAALSATQAHAAPDEGGVGCLPGGFSAPEIPMGSGASLLEWEWPPGQDPLPDGGNCNSVRVHAVSAGSTSNEGTEVTSRSHTFAWEVLPHSAMLQRTLFIRANTLAALTSTEALSLEIYRQRLHYAVASHNPQPMEIRVLLVRMPAIHETLDGLLPTQTEVWVVVQDQQGQLGHLRAPINEMNAARCTRGAEQFAACIDIDAKLTQLQLSLHSARDDQTLILPPAQVTQILLGNVATSVGRSSDVFNLAHSAHANQ